MAQNKMNESAKKRYAEKIEMNIVISYWERNRMRDRYQNQPSQETSVAVADS